VSTLPNLFPALDAATEDALRESIKRFGVLVPVARDQHGRTLDGHHRARIADEVGAKYRVDVIRVEDDDQARDIAATLNIDRRQLDADQRREIVAALREHGHSLRAIAGAVGADAKTVRNDLAGGDLSPPAEVRGQDGKRYPARRPTIVATKDERQAEKAQRALASSGDTPEGPRTVRDIGRQSRAQERADISRIEGATSEPAILDATVCPVAEFGPAEQVDWIITDPPYPREFLPVYADLAATAARILRPGGSLICMAGQSYLPQIVERLALHLTYQWTLAYLTPGGQATQLWERKVNTFWKPLLWFTKGEYEGPWVGDVTRSEVNDNDKRFHHWGQAESGMADIVRRFTKPGDLIADPFLGGGTTGIVALSLGRRFVGCDIDPAAIDATRSRLAA
jgi:site-specific DNA-methyltransferase (adenine-specific)